MLFFIVSNFVIIICILLMLFMFNGAKRLYFFVVYLAFINGLFLLVSNTSIISSPVLFKLIYVLMREGVIYSLFYISLLAYFLKKSTIKKNDIGTLIFVFVGVILLVVHGNPSFNIRIGGFKELYTFVILYFIGEYSLIKDEAELIKFGRRIVSLGIVLSIIVLIEASISIITSSYILDSLGIGKYFYMMFKASSSLYGSQDMTNNAIGSVSLPGNFGSEIGMRYSGVSLDPAAFAFYMTFPLIWSLILKKRIATMLFWLSIILSFGKGGMILAASTTAFYLWKNRKNGYIYLAIPLVLLFGVIAFNHIAKVVTSGSTGAHFQFFMDGVKVLTERPLGYGMGNGGGMGYMAGVKGVGDTFFGSVISQEGLIGIIAFSIALFGIAQYLNRIREVMAPGVLKEFTSLLTFSIVTGYVISALSGAPFLWNAMGIHMLFAGIVVGMKISTRTVISGGNQLS